MNHTELATNQAAGLRRLAELIEAHPELSANFRYTLNTAGISVHLTSEDKAAQLGTIARIALRHGATVTKDITDTWHNLVLDFDGIRAQVLAYRDQVCQRVVVGTREVVEEVPDPDAPTIQRTRTEDIVEWQCSPILAASMS